MLESVQLSVMGLSLCLDFNDFWGTGCSMLMDIEEGGGTQACISQPMCGSVS